MCELALAQIFVKLCRWLGELINRDRWRAKGTRTESAAEKEDRERECNQINSLQVQSCLSIYPEVGEHRVITASHSYYSVMF